MVYPVTTWMDLDGMMLGEINQIKTNAVWSYLYIESEKQTNSKKKKRSDLWLAGLGGSGGGTGGRWSRGTNFQL